MRNSVRRKSNFLCTASFTLFALVLPLAAIGQDYKNPERRFLDAIGVSITEGIYHREITPLTIGDPANGGLAWTYHGHAYTFKGDFTGTVTYDSTLNETTVSFGETSFPFENGTSYTNGHGSSDTLTAVAGGYVYTAEDGTIYNYTGSVSTSYTLASIVKPNGLKITINSSSVVTNTGYALKFDSSTSKISAVNMLAHSCDAQALSCDAYDNSIYFLSGYTDSSITGTGGRYQVTDALGNAWRWRWYFSYVVRNPSDPQQVDRGPGVVWAFKDPTGFLATLNYTSGTGDLTSYTDQRGTYTYANPVKDPAGAIIYSSTGSYNSGTSTGTTCYLDGLSHGSCYAITDYRTATNPYNGGPLGPYTRIVSVTNQESDSISFTYDSRGNITSTTRSPKPGSGLSATTTYSGYDATCSNLKTCNQPNWTKDAKGNQTDYTYDSTHGGVLTVTLPADQNGLRKRTYNTYTAFDTGNGFIYRLTRSETCGLNSSQLSVTACPNTSDTLVTLTDYGTSTTAPKTYKSFQPYTVTQTHGGASPLSATTTYTYDNLGNVTVIDGARTDVDDKVYKTYDLNRRVIFEIGVLPGGSGNPKRTVTRHTYDAAGRETKTEVGYANLNATNGSDFAVTAFTRMTYDAVGRLVKTEQVQP